MLALNPASWDISEILIGYCLALARQFLKELSIIVELERHRQYITESAAVSVAAKVRRTRVSFSYSVRPEVTHSQISSLGTVCLTEVSAEESQHFDEFPPLSLLSYFSSGHIHKG